LWWGERERGREGGRGLFWDAREVTKPSSIFNLESFGKKFKNGRPIWKQQTNE
jgi:hypothetical protein